MLRFGAIGAESGISFDVRSIVAASPEPLSVIACVSKTCETRSLSREAVVVQVLSAELGDGSTGVSLTATTVRGVKVFRGATSVVPAKVQPNGKGCPPVAWQATVVATGADTLTVTKPQ